MDVGECNRQDVSKMRDGSAGVRQCCFFFIIYSLPRVGKDGRFYRTNELKMTK